MSKTITTPANSLETVLDPSVTRDRLLLAMAESITEKGLAKTVVADVVSRARVSRRTFYEEFEDRGACFAELCDRTTDVARDLIAAAADPELPWREQAERAVDAYFAFMGVQPELTRSLLQEIHVLGEAGYLQHQRTSHEFTLQLVELAERARENDPSMQPLNYATAAAVVAGIYELLVLAHEDDGRVSPQEARDAALRIVLAAASTPPA